MMSTVAEIRAFLQTLAPEHTAAQWDHVGLLCGRSDRTVTRVLVALDPSPAACEEAAALDCQLLLTHHPLIWKLDRVTEETDTGRRLLFLIEHGIAALNAHTNLDVAPGGVNDVLAARLGLRDVTVIDPEGTDSAGRPYGLLRGGAVAPQEPEAFALHVRDALACPGVRYVLGAGTVRRVAVGGGSCSDALERVAALGYDAFVTADCKYHGFCDAQALGLTLIDAGHFETENPVCPVVAQKLREAFPDLTVFVSKNHTDCIKFA